MMVLLAAWAVGPNAFGQAAPDPAIATETIPNDGSLPRAIPTRKKETIFQRAEDRIREKLRRPSMTNDELNGYMWNFRRETDPSDIAIREDVRQSEETPFWSRRSVWADATGPRRAATFGVGPLSRQATERPTLRDRDAASETPELDYFNKAENDEILAAVYRHMFGYRNRGFAADATVCFLGLGPHITDAPPSLLAALQRDSDVVRRGMKVRPLSKVLEVTDEAIRDRDTGAYGPAFRVDDISLPDAKGNVRVLATFTEREGFWFSRDLTVRPGSKGWVVVADNDYAR